MTTDVKIQMREAIENAVQVKVDIIFPTTTRIEREAIKTYRDATKDLLTTVSREFTDLLSANVSKERLKELLPNQDFPYIYKISVLEKFGEPATVFLSNGNGSKVKEQIQYITVCMRCGSDSIVNSRWGTDDDWCDQCGDFSEQIEFSQKDFHKKQFDFPVDLEGNPINDNAEGKGLPQYADQELVKREIKEKSNE